MLINCWRLQLKQRKGTTLDEELANIVGDAFDFEAYWSLVEDNLRNRRLRLIYVADKTPRKLRCLVEFINDEMVNIEVLAVENHQYKRNDESGQVALVPRVVGMIEAARSLK